MIIMLKIERMNELRVALLPSSRNECLSNFIIILIGFDLLNLDEWAPTFEGISSLMLEYLSLEFRSDRVRGPENIVRQICNRLS